METTILVRPRRTWTEQDIADLKKWQAEKVPTKEQADRLGRSPGSIKDKIRELGIGRRESGPPWTKEEIGLLKKWCRARVPIKVQAKRLGRGRHGVRDKIRKLKIAGIERPCRPWTPEEVELLKEWKSDGATVKAMANRLERTVPQVRSKIRRMHLASGKWGRAWTAKEKKLVQQWQEQGVPGKEQAKRLGRSYASWSQGVARYELQGEHSKYRPELRTELMGLVETGMNQAQMADHLGRSRAAVGAILRDLVRRGLLTKEKRCGPYKATKAWTG